MPTGVGLSWRAASKAATKAEEREGLHQQHFLVVFAGAGEKKLSAGAGGQECSQVLPQDRGSSSPLLLFPLCRGPH